MSSKQTKLTNPESASGVTLEPPYLISNSSITAVVDASNTPAAAAAENGIVTFRAAADTKFKFVWMEKAKLEGFSDKDVQASLFKWGMQDHMYIKRFGFDRDLHAYDDVNSFLLDFFNDGEVNSHLKAMGTKDRWCTLGRVTRIEKEETLHTVTSLAFFDRLTTIAGVVRHDGSIKKCLDEYHDSFVVGDELRALLLMPENEHYDTYSEADRQEFVFHLFKALCLGGRLCQYEDEIEPYLTATKKLYKDLISVTKQNGVLRVSSLVYKILKVDSSVSPLFPKQHPQNFCYLSIDPNKRHVNVFYHACDTYYS
ncbi:hypothetical protein HK100_001660 [Physocladia obscura]|uniref:Cilia- and flagella-associated protein 300 n=1 Tax=Physocladia obscura TaxID=109957 RepID=A0AAD5SYI0_9FUNG|nr:hypothetical protein HK100_001660 [Physocladia obscura]